MATLRRLCLHKADRFLRTKEVAREIGADNGAPLFVGEIFHRDSRRADAGIVEAYVEAAENFAGPTPDGDVLCQSDSSEHGLKARIGAKRIVGRVDLHAANG